jgi:hypothetical protein
LDSTQIHRRGVEALVQVRAGHGHGPRGDGRDGTQGVPGRTLARV